MRKYLIVVFTTALSGCAQYWWYKDSVSQQQADQDGYACLQEAQQRVSGASYNAYGGVAQNQVITNQNLFNACMRARGYRYQQRVQ
jgi:hypothetical protein